MENLFKETDYGLHLHLTTLKNDRSTRKYSIATLRKSKNLSINLTINWDTFKLNLLEIYVKLMEN